MSGMQISGLDLTLRRIQNIEKQLNNLSSVEVTSNEFQNLLNKNIEKKSQTTEKISKAEIDTIVDKYATKQGLDADFVKSVIKQESAFDPKATSSAGAMGLMQLMPQTADSLGVTNAYNAEQNIQGGTKYLKELLSKYEGNKELALAAYNAGPTAVNKHKGIPPYMETQDYVKKVLGNYQSLKVGGNL